MHDLSRRSVLTTALLGAGGAALLAPSSAMAAPTVTRSTAIDRAWYWVNQNVQYSQDGTYPGPGGTSNYRRDCSGFVSMCLMLPAPGPNTTALAGGTYTSGIAKANLKKGDMLVLSGVHCVLFQRWDDAAQTRFWLFEQSNPQDDMNHRVASLSTYSSYTARRAHNIIDG